MSYSREPLIYADRGSFWGGRVYALWVEDSTVRNRLLATATHRDARFRDLVLREDVEIIATLEMAYDADDDDAVIGWTVRVGLDDVSEPFPTRREGYAHLRQVVADHVGGRS